MCKKVIYLTSFVLVLVLAGNAPAATLLWDNGGEGNLWNVPENWNPDGVPGGDDTAQINLPDVNCLIDYSVDAICTTVNVGLSKGLCYLDMTGGTLTTTTGPITVGRYSDSNGVFVMSGGVATSGGTNSDNRLWVGYGGSGTLIMTGGEMNVYNKVEVGKNAGSNGVIYMHGGTMNFSGPSCDLEIGRYGTGTVYMTGGVINVEDTIKMGADGGTACIYLYGGTIYHGDDNIDLYDTSTIDITEGTLILPGDETSQVNEYINRGWIIGYDGLGILNVVHTEDPNQTAVTASELPPELAWNPGPRNQATIVWTPDGLTLGWIPGDYAASHDVYFGTDPNAVNDANNVQDANNIALWPEFKGNQDPCSYDPGSLELGKTYYWRIDEVNDEDPNSPWKGVLWAFTVADYVVVDDFESYNDIEEGEESNLVYMTWSDGGYGLTNDPANGSTIGYLSVPSLEIDNVHGGAQSAPFAYNNSTATYSEVTVNLEDLGISPDLTVDNFKTLSLWFYGGSNNSTTDQMYMKLNGVKVVYDGPQSDLKLAEWQEWRIDLESFGIDLNNITELGIGFERMSTFGGTGSILIDDIRLYISGDEEEIL